MKNNEFELTLNGDIINTSFKRIEKWIVPYFNDIEKLNFHDDGHNVTIENKEWDIYIYLSDVFTENEDEDYLMSIAYKGSFEDGERAVKDFAAYLSEHGFVFSLEYEDIDNNGYTIKHPDLMSIFINRKGNTN